MIKMILSGCNGKMGKVITDCITQHDECEIVAGIDITGTENGSFPVFISPDSCNISGDVIVDFSNPVAIEPLLRFAISKKIPIVVATTGFSKVQIEHIHEAAKQIPVFFSFNMSIGVNLMVELAKKATAILGEQFDIEIVEKHHNQKIDAPSGTALMLADAISDTLKEQPKYIYDRHSVRKKRSKNEIGISSIRGGTIVGEHDIIFAGRDELITLTHSAMSKEIFATGSVNAAIFISNQQPGLYNMGDLILSK